MRIAIIGGGACGLVCAHQIKKDNPEADVVILERSPTVGKKILMTGNSKGNLTNLHVAPEAYNHPEFVKPALRYGANEFLGFAHQLGLLTITDEEGRVYPRSESANSYLDVLRISNKELGIKELTSYEVFSIEKKEHAFMINGTETYDIVVIATGSNAGYGPKVPVTSLPRFQKSAGHQYTALYPSLAPIGVQENVRSLSGLRIKCGASIFINGVHKYSTKGEVQFKDDALSGIAIFELSSFLARCQVADYVTEAKVELDLFPEISELDVQALLAQRRDEHPDRSVSDYFIGLFTKMIGLFIINRLRINSLDDKTIVGLAHELKHFSFAVNLAFKVYTNQVVSGGIRLEEVDSTTLESKIIPSLYLGGEVLDVDGLCGGYNLHFAFASGMLIAKAITERIQHD